MPKIIGITGTIGAGKGVLAKYLVEKHNYLHLSVRSFLEEQLKKANLPLTRDNMVVLANDLRKQHGAEYIVMKLYEIASESGRNSVIESIRTLGEVEALKAKPGFELWAVDAPIEIRYQRIVVRNSSTDQVSFDEFKRQESLEMHSDDKARLNLKGCIEQADKLFTNDSDLDTFFAAIETALN